MLSAEVGSPGAGQFVFDGDFALGCGGPSSQILVGGLPVVVVEQSDDGVCTMTGDGMVSGAAWLVAFGADPAFGGQVLAAASGLVS
jgi:hypothetical protein